MTKQLWPKAWVEAVKVHLVAPSVYSSNAVSILNALDEIGALEDLPKPMLLYACSVHNGFMWYSPRTDAPHECGRKQEYVDGTVCKMRLFREVVE